jgi:hypothetical protein
MTPVKEKIRADCRLEVAAVMTPKSHRDQQTRGDIAGEYIKQEGADGIEVGTFQTGLVSSLGLTLSKGISYQHKGP